MKKMFKAKKGALDAITALISGVLVLVILMGVSFLVMAAFRTQVGVQEGITVGNTSTYTDAYNATVEVEQAAYDIPGWVPLIILVVIAVAILGLVALIRRVMK